jgi:hypothetical protein
MDINKILVGIVGRQPAAQELGVAICRLASMLQEQSNKKIHGIPPFNRNTGIMSRHMFPWVLRTTLQMLCDRTHCPIDRNKIQIYDIAFPVLGKGGWRA